MERRTDFFDVQRHVARKIGNTEATAQINERRASVCFLGQSGGKRQRRTLSINNGVSIQSLRSGKNVKPTPIGAGRDHMANQGRRPLCVNSERSEEHTSELQSLMRISYAVFCLKTKTR